MGSVSVTESDDLRMPAAVALLGRTGADHFEIRYCEESEPVVWIAAAHWPDRPEVGMPDHYEVAGGLTPWRAMFRLCEAVMDGGVCRHCGRPTMVDDKPADSSLAAMEAVVCSYRYDPELDTFRRACEGVA